MFVYLINGPAAHADAPASLFSDGEGLVVITQVLAGPGGDAGVRRRLAVYRVLGQSGGYATFAGWDDEIDRADDICAELWAGDARLYQPVDGNEPGGNEVGEVVLRLLEREPEMA